MFPKIVGFPSKSSILINRVFHDFHHPFWGTPIFGNTHIMEHNAPILSVYQWTKARMIMQNPRILCIYSIYIINEINQGIFWSHCFVSFFCFWFCRNHAYALSHLIPWFRGKLASQFFSRMRSEGFPFIVGVWGWTCVRVVLLSRRRLVVARRRLVVVSSSWRR